MKAIKTTTTNGTTCFAFKAFSSKGKRRIVLIDLGLDKIFSCFGNKGLEEFQGEDVHIDDALLESKTKEFSSGYSIFSKIERSYEADCEKFAGKKLKQFIPVTKLDAKFRSNVNSELKNETLFLGTISVTNSSKRGRYFNYSTETVDGIFYNNQFGGISKIGCGEIVSSRKKNYRTDLKEISLQDARKFLYKKELERLNEIEQNNVNEFNQALTRFALDFVSKLEK